MGANQGGRGVMGRGKRRGEVVGLEALEGRALLSTVVSEIATLPGSVTVGPMAVAMDGSLWVAEAGRKEGPALERVTAAGVKSESVLPATDVLSTITSVAADGNGNVWYTLANSRGSATGVVGKVGADLSIKETVLPALMGEPGASTMGSDGRLWVALSGGQGDAALAAIGSDGKVSGTYPVAGAKALSSVGAGGDGNVWFVDGHKIGKITPKGVITEFDQFAPGGGAVADLGNAQLTAGPDGNVWFLGLGGVSKITPGGNVTTAQVPGSPLHTLSRGSDGNMWVTFSPPATGPLASVSGAMLAKVSPDDKTSLLPDKVSAPGTPVVRTAAGMDGGLWFGEGGGKIGRADLSAAAAATPTPTPVSLKAVNIGLVTTDIHRTVSGRVVEFVSTDAGAKAGDYQATIDWGDGHTSGGAIAENATGAFDVSGSHVYASAAGGPRNVVVLVTGANGSSPFMGLVRVIDSMKSIPPWQAYPAAPDWQRYTGTGRPSPVTTPPVVVPNVPTPPPVMTTPITPAPVTLPPPTTPVARLAPPLGAVAAQAPAATTASGAGAGAGPNGTVSTWRYATPHGHARGHHHIRAAHHPKGPHGHVSKASHHAHRRVH